VSPTFENASTTETETDRATKGSKSAPIFGRATQEKDCQTEAKESDCHLGKLAPVWKKIHHGENQKTTQTGWPEKIRTQ
jgi:hypothetical protein